MTEKQKLFAETYLANGYNALGAYNQVFGDYKKNKPSYPYTLLKNTEIKNYIEDRRQEIYGSLNIDAIRVMEEIANIAFEPINEKNINAKLKALELLSKNLQLQNNNKSEDKGVIEITLEDDIND